MFRSPRTISPNAMALSDRDDQVLACHDAAVIEAVDGFEALHHLRPYLTVLGRAGLNDITTCAAGASVKRLAIDHNVSPGRTV